MSIRNKLLVLGTALALSTSMLAHDKKPPVAKPKVMIEITQKALKSGKVLIKDGSVYLRIGKVTSFNGGKSNAVMLQANMTAPEFT